MQPFKMSKNVPPVQPESLNIKGKPHYAFAVEMAMAV
jgi:hypothetical protein